MSREGCNEIHFFRPWLVDYKARQGMQHVKLSRIAIVLNVNVLIQSDMGQAMGWGLLRLIDR